MAAEQRGSAYKTKTQGWGVRWVDQAGQRQRQPGFATKTAALNHYRDAIRPRLGRAADLDPRTVTLDDLADRYLEAHGAVCAPSTIQTLTDRLKRPRDRFGKLSLDRLERVPHEIAAFRATIPEASRFGVMQAFRQTLAQAIAWGLMDTNPAVRAGKNPAPRRAEVEPFPRDELDAVIAELGKTWGPLVRFAAETGMRPSEWIALEWRDVDVRQAVAVVERSYNRGRLSAYGKTAGSRRSVPLSDAALEALAAVPRRIGSRPLVFAGPRGDYLDLHNFRAREWIPAFDAAGVPRRRIYDLRHTFATEAIAAGVPLYALARFMGTSLRMIDSTYGHLTADAHVEARALLNARNATTAARSGHEVATT